jgi:tetratricopeptide (TPR) repeat protein
LPGRTILPIRYYNRVNVYRNLQRFDEALIDYTQAIQVDPTFELAYVNRASIYEQLRRYDAALTDYIQAIKLDPNDRIAYYNLGLLLYNFGKSQEALPLFEVAAQLGMPQGEYYVERIKRALDDRST